MTLTEAQRREHNARKSVDVRLDAAYRRLREANEALCDAEREYRLAREAWDRERPAGEAL
jgi:hypothetical protein